MRTFLFSALFLTFPLFVTCQEEAAPQKSGSFYIETAEFTGDISELTLRPSIGVALSDNFVLNLGFSNVVTVITDGWSSSEAQTASLALGGRYFTKNNVFFGGRLFLLGTAIGANNTIDDLAIGTSLSAEVGKYLSLGEYFYVAPKILFSGAVAGDSSLAAGSSGTQVVASIGVRL
mgnify:CR=1 FL=1